MKSAVLAAFAALLAMTPASSSWATDRGDYYDGIDRNNNAPRHPPRVDRRFSTGSISNSDRLVSSPNSGDYYEGATRPN